MRKAIPKRLVEAIRARGACDCCGTTEGPFDVDHKLPVWLDGDNAPDNLWLLCKSCHADKTSKEARARAKIAREHKRRETPRGRPRFRASLRNQKYKRKVDGSVVVRPEWRERHER